MGSALSKAAGLALVTAACSGVTDTVGVKVPPAYTVPASIASDCSVDVTQDLHSWFASVPDSSTLEFGEGACYRIDGGLQLRDRHALTLEGNGSTFQVFGTGHGQRANWIFWGGSNLTVRNMIARGANPNAGTSSAAYVASLEWQHGYRLRGVQGAVLDNVQAYDVYGDFVNLSHDSRAKYPGEPNRNIVIRNSRFERNGRMGISVTHADGVVVEDNYIGDVRWSAFDLELNHSVESGKNIRIERNRFGPTLHHMFVAKGAGFSESVGSITIRGNEMEPPHMLTCLPAIAVSTPAEDRFWSGWVIEGNTLRTRNRGLGVELTRTKDVLIRNNTIINGATGGCGKEATIQLADSHGGKVTGNTMIGPWPATHVVDSATSGFEFSNNVLK